MATAARTILRAAMLAAVAAPGVASAQPAPPARAPTPAPPAAVPNEDSGPGDVVAAAAPPRPVVLGPSIPDVPSRAPERIAVMAFENRANVRAIDWTVAGVPLLLGERFEEVLGLAPAWGPLVVPPGPVVPASPDVVATFAAQAGAHWVVTGWVERPNWDLRLAVTLWKVTGPLAVPVGEVVQRAPFAQVYEMIGTAAVDLARRAGFRVPDGADARFKAPASADFYAFTLVGRGVGHLVGAIGPVDRKAAERDLTRSVFIDPNMAVGQRLVGELLLGDPTDPRAGQRAAGKFNYAVDLRGDYAPAVRAAALSASAAGKRDSARDLYGRLVTLRPWDLEARYRLGEAMWQTGDVDGALRELGRVLKRDPDDLRARRVLALIHASRGETQNLVHQLEEILRRDPGDADARSDLGAAYAATNRWPEATDAWEKVATARPADATAQKRVGDAWRRRGDAARAALWYARAAQVAPDDPRPAFLTGAAWLAQGDLQSANRAYIRAQKYKDYLGQAYSALGVIAFERKDLDTSVWYLRRAAKLLPRSRGARYDYVLLLDIRKEWDLALFYVDLALTYWRDDADFHYLRGLALAGRGDTGGARKAFDRAISIDPGHGPARRAATAVERSGALHVEGTPAIEHPFGDADYFRGVIDRYFASELEMARLRAQLGRQVLGVLGALNEGPGKDKKVARAGAVRLCPLTKVARPWAEAQRTLTQFERLGADLENDYREVVDLDTLGESQALMPDYRSKVTKIRTSWKLAQADLRELRNVVYVQLLRELRARRCSDPLLAAALAQPQLYALPEEVRREPAPAPAAPAKREPARATFYVDNRECTDPVTVWVDGEQVGEVPPGERSALSSLIGRRTVCLLVGAGAGACGDRGTVRQAYLHDGWQVRLRCPAGFRASAAPAKATEAARAVP